MRLCQVIFAPEAKDDLFGLYDWIAATASPDIALSCIERIETYYFGFTHAAERGTRRDDIRPGMRVVGFEGRVTIAFSIIEERVTILQIFYAGRNWEEIMR